MQVFWLSLFCLPSQPDRASGICSTKVCSLAYREAGITAAGPLPIFTGFP